MKAMILAAGFGTRLRPLTFDLPKPMFPILGRPTLEHTIRLLRRHGITDIAVNLHHLPEKVTGCFGDGTALGVRLHWSVEEAILGTAGGIKKAQRFLDGGAFVVINSDVLTDIDLGRVIDFHRQRGAAATLVLKPGDSPETCDPIEVDPEGRIVHMVGQPSRNVPEATRRFTFTGIQVLEPEIFERIPVGTFYGTTNNVFPEMIGDGRPFFAYEHTGYWMDIGRRESYLQAHRDALDGRVRLETEASAPAANAASPVWIGKSCRIADTARIGPYAVLGDSVIVDDDVTLEDSVVMSGAVLSAGCSVHRSVIGPDAITGAKERVEEQSIAARR